MRRRLRVAPGDGFCYLNATVSTSVFDIAIWAVPLLVAVILHEIAHGYVAFRLGDPTAKLLGRLTLNPIPHIDLFGTVLLPGMLIMSGAPFVFGYAKPVPVNFGRLRDPKRDMVLVAAAGPAVNLILASLSATAFKVVNAGAAEPDLLALALLYSVFINVTLAVFNMLPIPPLDGGRVAVGLLPRALALPFARLEPFGMLVVVLLLMTGTLGTLIGPVQSAFLRVLL